MRVCRGGGTFGGIVKDGAEASDAVLAFGGDEDACQVDFVFVFRVVVFFLGFVCG